MNNYKSIKSKLFLSTMVGIVGFISISIAIYFSINNLLTLKNSQTKVVMVNKDLISLKEIQNSFIVKKDIKYKDDFLSTFNQIRLNISGIKVELISNKDQIKNLTNSLENYKDMFLQIVSLQQSLGLNYNDGIYAQLNKSVKNAQKLAREAGFDKSLVLMYRLRKLEKEFILTNENKYMDQFNTIYIKLVRLINTHSDLCADETTNLKNLKEYYDSMIKLANTINKMGLNSNTGILSQTKNILKESEQIINTLSQNIKNEIDTKIDNTILILLLSFLAVVILTLVSSYIISHKIINQLKEFYSSITNSSAQIVSISTSVAQHAITLSNSSKSQATTVQELSATVDELTASTRDNSNSAQEAKVVSGEIDLVAHNGFDDVKSLTESMDNINNSSKQIANIIKSIDEIAFQTNLLSLNAAVEAARAGEQGMGFAVVAEEVRALAGKSAQSAKETTSIIDSAIAQVSIGDKITHDVNIAFDKILQSLDKNKNAIEEISYASKEQSEEMKQINQAIIDVENTTQNMSDSSENLAESSEKLNSLIHELNRVLISVKDLIGVTKD